MKTGWTQLPSGKAYWPLFPRKHVPSPEDIAHKGAQTNRYGGSCKFPYSLNQHQVLGARAMLRDGYSPAIAKAFLFHDMAEPLGVQDLASPIKRYKPKYWWQRLTPHYIKVKLFVCLHKWLEDSILDTLLDKYGVSRDNAVWNIVKAYDQRITIDEKEQVMAPAQHDWGLSKLKPLGITIEQWSWERAKKEWLGMYYELD